MSWDAAEMFANPAIRFNPVIRLREPGWQKKNSVLHYVLIDPDPNRLIPGASSNLSLVLSIIQIHRELIYTGDELLIRSPGKAHARTNFRGADLDDIRLGNVRGCRQRSH